MHGPERIGSHNTDPLVRALEQAPLIGAPDDFVARVLARLPAKPSRRLLLSRYTLRRHRVGPAVAAASLCLLLAAMLALAPHTAASTSWLFVQTMLFVNFCVLLLWTGRLMLRR